MPAKSPANEFFDLRDSILRHIDQGLTQKALGNLLNVPQSEISRCCTYFGISWPKQVRDQWGKNNHAYKEGLGKSTIERTTRMVLLKEGRNLYICERCGMKSLNWNQELPRHHKDRNRANNTLKNLEVLCWSCHTKEHTHEKVRDETGKWI